MSCASHESIRVSPSATSLPDMPIAQRCFEALFNFTETDYVATRRSLFQRCTFEALRANKTSGHTRVIKERALFPHPRVAAGRPISSGWHSTPSVSDLRAETATAVRAFEEKYPGLLAKLETARKGSCTMEAAASPITCKHMTGDARQMHRLAVNGVFQVASQLNLLEFSSSAMSPEHGVRHYACYSTQGPACAFSCMGGTVYRNYLLHPDFFGVTDTAPFTEDVDEAARGQRADRQLNMLDDLVVYLTRARNSDSDVSAADATNSTARSAPALPREHFFTICNGYFVHKPQIASLPERLQFIAAVEGISITDVEEEMASRLRIGLVEDTTVTLSVNDTSVSRACEQRQLTEEAVRKAVPALSADLTSKEEVHEVTQTYNSALSLPLKDQCTPLEWSGLATLSRIILRGTYEATLLVGVQHTLRELEKQASLADVSSLVSPHFSLPPIFLTKVGGGVFNNDAEWIASGMASAVHSVAALSVPLNVRLVHFRKVDEYYLKYFPSWAVLD
ncbi:hypothetical protein, unknown function [Leishmania tarentolae]|uniref:Uncharacterized protein n=1 Tax=Leishmania tarentolae TaxID=5689 RepID=A0A640KLS7_LEITA|nr:hypothetical protein, unknown function [Leishmania tarentolae]